MTIRHQAENILIEKIYIQNIVWKFCGDHILIKFFFERIIDIQTNFKKK